MDQTLRVTVCVSRVVLKIYGQQTPQGIWFALEMSHCGRSRGPGKAKKHAAGSTFLVPTIERGAKKLVMYVVYGHLRTVKVLRMQGVPRSTYVSTFLAIILVMSTLPICFNP